MKNNLAYNAYSQNSIAIESSEKLISMLYEGILKFSSLAIRAIDLEDIKKKVYYINKSVAIFTELINTLDYKNGQDTALYLSGLYTHQIKMLTLGNIESNKEHILMVIDVTKTLSKTWKEENGLELFVD